MSNGVETGRQLACGQKAAWCPSLEPKNLTSSWPKTDMSELMVRPFSKRQRSPLAKMLSVRGVVEAHNQKIVKVDKNKRQTSKNVVNHELEHGAGGPKGIQRNSKRLMMVVLGMSSGNILVPFDEVKRGENVGAIHIVCECWDQVLVQQGCIVEPGRISTWAPRAIRFGTM